MRTALETRTARPIRCALLAAATFILMAAIAAPYALAGGGRGGAQGGAHKAGHDHGKGNEGKRGHGHERVKSARDYDATIPVAWFDLLYKLIKDEKLSPPVASRRIGYAGVALYETIVPGAHGYRTLAHQLNELDALPKPDHHQAIDWALAANAALAGTLRGLFAGATPATGAAIDALEHQLGVAQSGAGPATVARSVAHGRSVAEAILAWSASDGFSSQNNCAYTAPMGAGLWVPTPPALAPPLQPCWGQLRPFVLVSGAECAPPAPPAFSTDHASAFYAEGLEVYNTTTHLTPDQTAIAQFWADNAGATGTPPGHWTSITGQIARAQRISLDRAAEAYARVGIAVADSFIACWHTKFVHNLLRPITYIQATIDPAWSPLLPTPPFPEYTSGHSVQSAAASTVLADFLGAVPFTDSTHAALGFPARSFVSFREAAAEAAISRLYGGIHYRAAIERGLQQGECIGRTILAHVRFGPRDDHGDDHGDGEPGKDDHGDDDHGSGAQGQDDHGGA